MALRGYFYRTWYPGMNDENGVVDLDKVYKCSRRLGRAKKWTCYLLIIGFAILLLSLLIYNFMPNSRSGDDQPAHHHHDHDHHKDHPGCNGTGTTPIPPRNNEQVTDFPESSGIERGAALPQTQTPGYDKVTALPSKVAEQRTPERSGHESGGILPQTRATAYSKRTALPTKVADDQGRRNCWGRRNGFRCPCQKSSFRCNRFNSEECVLPEMVCDGSVDCSNGQDEADCISLSTSTLKFEEYALAGSLKGYVLIRRRGVWHPYCTNDWSKILGTKICQKLGFQRLDFLETVDFVEFNQRKQFELVEHKDLETDSSDELVELIVAGDLEDFEKTATDLAEASTGDNQQWTSCKVGYVRCARNDELTKKNILY